MRRPFTGAWIETPNLVHDKEVSEVAPSRGRGLKRYQEEMRGKGISRPFTGAWIETLPGNERNRQSFVAPSRGRGLKL